MTGGEGNQEGESGEVVLPPEAVKRIGDEVAGRLLSIETSFQGPLPPPAMLAAYDRALPGCAERIVTMVETEGDHRRDCERRIVRAGIRLGHIGQAMALVIALSALGLAGLLLYENKKIGGLAALVIGIGTLVGVFYYAQRQPPANLPERTNGDGRAGSDSGDSPADG